MDVVLAQKITRDRNGTRRGIAWRKDRIKWLVSQWNQKRRGRDTTARDADDSILVTDDLQFLTPGVSQRGRVCYPFFSPSHNLVNRVMEWIENRVARAARWLTSWNPADVLVWLFVVCVTCALLGPWLQRSRDESRRVETMDRLRHMGTAMHSYSELHRTLPSGGRPRPAAPNRAPNDTDTTPSPVRPIQDTP